MTTAQRIIRNNSTAQAIEAEARDLATKTTAANCYDRTWTFYDGSTVTKTSDGYTAGGRQVTGAEQALATLRDYVERSFRWREGGADRHAALLALKVLEEERSLVCGQLG